jgi:hypothetical protein
MTLSVVVTALKDFVLGSISFWCLRSPDGEFKDKEVFFGRTSLNLSA